MGRSLLCVRDDVAHRKNTVELYGYDFMVSSGDEKPEVWLIEVNSSPACDYSTPVTCPLVKKVMEDTAKVMVDLPENPDASTGEWELLKHNYNKAVIHKHNHNLNMEVIGKNIKPPKGFKKKKKAKKKKSSGSADGEADGNGDDDDDNDDDDDDTCES